MEPSYQVPLVAFFQTLPIEEETQKHRIFTFLLRIAEKLSYQQKECCQHWATVATQLCHSSSHFNSQIEQKQCIRTKNYHIPHADTVHKHKTISNSKRKSQEYELKLLETFKPIATKTIEIIYNYRQNEQHNCIMAAIL